MSNRNVENNQFDDIPIFMNLIKFDKTKLPSLHFTTQLQ